MELSAGLGVAVSKWGCITWMVPVHIVRGLVDKLK